MKIICANYFLLHFMISGIFNRYLERNIIVNMFMNNEGLIRIIDNFDGTFHDNQYTGASVFK